MRSHLRHCLILLLCSLPQIARAAEQFFDSNGVKIRYITAGRGETVILIHGFAVPSAEQMWIRNPLNEPKVFPELARQFRVVALDLRGHGKSGKPLEPKDYGVEMMEDVVRLMDHLQIKRAHVVGYSLGALIAGKLLVTHPDRLLSVTLGGGAPAYQPTQKSIDTVDALAKSLREGKGAAILVPVIFPAGEPLSQEQAEIIGNALVFGQNQQALSAVISGIKDLEVTEQELKANKVPVLMIYGSREGEAKERIDRVSKVLSEHTSVVIKGGDHFNTFATVKFRNSILDFLKSHPETRPSKEAKPT